MQLGSDLLTALRKEWLSVGCIDTETREDSL
jgi:hypothetical protein